MIKENTSHVIVCAQSMDPLAAGRGMGHVLPESLKEAVFLNHAENQKTVSELYHTIQRAKELDMITVVCADSTVEAKAAACMDPDIVLAEPTDLIGTGQVADDSYTTETVKALNEVNPNVLVMIASGVSTAEDCYNVVKLGADGTGATSGILNAPSPAERVREMAEAIVKAKNEKQ
nr:triose-phosphate isomerase [uncultured Anaerostipes sp.]